MNGHTMCESHITEKLTEDEKEDCQITQEHCPICLFTDFANDEFIKYYLKKNGLTRKEVSEKLGLEFDGNYKQFTNYIKKKVG